MIDPVEFGKAMGQLVREAVAPLLERIAALEARLPVRGEKGDAGPAGEQGAQGPQGVAGEPGARGEKGDKGDCGKDADVDTIISEVVSRILVSEGLRTLTALQAAESVAEYMAANPVRDGKDGLKGEKGDRGEKGDTGADGVGLAGFVINRDGNLIATTTKGEAHDLGRIVGADGKDGENGKDGANGVNGADGLSLESFDLQYDPTAHEVLLRCTAAGATKEVRFAAGGIRPGGFWREGMKCFGAQAITHDGALWIAKRDTAAKPCLENDQDWQLAARKGRDGRDGKDGKAPPTPVKLGGDNA